jgi:sulfur relay (sulfurtransferase) complex TusBCD TusD component (DsrE family)
MKTLFILNDAPYGSERTYNGLRLAGAISKQEGSEKLLAGHPNEVQGSTVSK